MNLFSTLFWGLTVLWALSEIFLGRHGVGVQSVASDRGSAVGFALAMALGITLAFEVRALGLLPIGAAWVRWLGLLAMAAGLALRVYSILWLEPMFTRIVQIVPGHRLITTGPYRFVRHPSYSGLLLLFLGMGLALGSWLSVAALVLIPSVGIAYRIMVEERALLAAFGEEYEGYKGRVRRLLPFVL